MPLLCVDLDNTLVDRSAAFAAFAGDYVAGLGRGTGDAEWLVETDGDGFTPREVVVDAVRKRFGLATTSADDLLATLRAGLVERMELDPAIPAALGRARRAGWPIVVVTNGATAQQTRKIEVLGLRPLVDAVVVSESAGMRKPDPRIFDLAARAGGSPLDGGWMIGDSATADVGGAHAAGLHSVWLDRGRAWPGDLLEPTHRTTSFAAAVDHVLLAPIN